MLPLAESNLQERVARCFSISKARKWSIADVDYAFNPFTATGCIYTSQKRPSGWPRTHIKVQPQFRFHTFVKARPATDVVGMSRRCLLPQLVDRCLLSWALFIEKTVLLCFARFLFKLRETALSMLPDATQAGTSCTFDGFRYDHDGDRGESGFVWSF